MQFQNAPPCKQYGSLINSTNIEVLHHPGNLSVLDVIMKVFGSLVKGMVLAFFLCQLSQAQTTGSGGPGSGGSGSGGTPWTAVFWPPNLPFQRPSDIPPTKMIANSELQITGNLKDGLVATYVVTGVGLVQYRWEENSTTIEGTTVSVRNCFRTTAAWVNGVWVSKSMAGFEARRLGTSRIVPTETYYGDTVSTIGISYDVAVNDNGQIESFSVLRGCGASIFTRNTQGLNTTEKTKTISSWVKGGPSFVNPTEVAFDEFFFCSLEEVPPVVWYLTRKSWTSAPVDEQGSYPSSGNPGGTLSIAAFTIPNSANSYKHIITPQILNPPPESRNILFYSNFSSVVTWSFPPWIAW